MIKTIPLFFKAVAVFAYLMASFSAQAESEVVRKKHYNLDSQLALQGYDPVSYVDDRKAVSGSGDFVHTHNGVRYQFSKEAHLEKFKANPEKYEPQYGGWCAYALAQGNGKVKINPERFKVIDGKLYLFFHSGPWGNTLKRWNKGDDAGQVATADKAWNEIVAE